MEGKDLNLNSEEQTLQSGKNSVEDTSILPYLRDLVIWLCAIMLVFMLLFRVVIVSGPSMRDTLIDGDYIVLINNTLYRKPKYGDIVVISKNSFKNGEPIIKRVIATEGQTVDIDFDLGIVYVDGQPLEEPYTKTPTNLAEGKTFPLVVDEGCLFVMGDNRNESKDSRDPEIGIVDCRQVMGKAIFLLVPGKDQTLGKKQFSRIGAIS